MVDLGSNKIHYVDVGEGPALLMLHGNPTSSLVWKQVIDLLSPSFRCIAPDYPGFGKSVAGEGYGFSPQEHAEVVAELIEHLDLRDYTLVMQDWGGPIGIAAASRDPARVAGLVIANTWAWPLNGVPKVEVMSRLMGGPLGRFAIKRFNLFVNATLPMGHRLRKLTAAEMDQYRSAFPTPKARLPTAVFPRALTKEREFLAHCEASLAHLSDRPALIVWADRDIAFGQRELERWQRLLPDSTTVPIPGAGHFLQSDAPDAVANAISGWAGVRAAEEPGPGESR
jgi:haloalkane dehalogenase